MCKINDSQNITWRGTQSFHMQINVLFIVHSTIFAITHKICNEFYFTKQHQQTNLPKRRVLTVEVIKYEKMNASDSSKIHLNLNEVIWFVVMKKTLTSALKQSVNIVKVDLVPTCDLFNMRIHVNGCIQLFCEPKERERKREFARHLSIVLWQIFLYSIVTHKSHRIHNGAI